MGESEGQLMILKKDANLITFQRSHKRMRDMMLERRKTGVGGKEEKRGGK